jgi:cyclohexadienyl dehydratase
VWAVVALAMLGCEARRPEPAATAAPGVLRVATSGDYAPFSIVNASGELTGMDIDVAHRLASDLGLRVEFVRFAWPQLADAAARQAFDIAMGGITMRPDRALIGRFTPPYAQVGAVALVRARDASRFGSLDALDHPDVRIAVNAGGHLERLARARFPQATIEPVPDNQAVPRRVRDGAADAAISDSAEAQSWLGPGLRALGPFSRDDKAYLLLAGDDGLAARVDDWLAAREGDGWLDAQRLRWIGPDAGLSADQAARSTVVAFVRLRLELAPAIGAAKRAAGLPIEDPEQEARVLARVRAAAGANAAQADAVYRQVIELSKAVQRSGAPSDITAELPALRDALARIDAALVPALAAAPPTDAATWDELLTAHLTVPSLDSAQLAALAAALGQ